MENSPDAQAAAPESPSTPIIPRYHLPDDWSGKGACPVCSTPGKLSVQHQDVTPDRIVCGACGTAFEVETAGPRIRLAAAPPGFAARTAGLLNTWVTPAELLLLLERAADTGPSIPIESPPADHVSVKAQQSPSAASLADSPAVGNELQTPMVPLAPEDTNGTGAEDSEAEPGTEDWFASLAAVIGGTLSVKPPPDAVLADELERVLLNRSENGATGALGPVVAAPGVTAAPAGPVPDTLLVPTPAAPETIKPAEKKTADVILAEAIAERAALGGPPASPAVPPVPAAAAPQPLPPPASVDSTHTVASAATPSTPANTALVPTGTYAVAAPGAAVPAASRRELAERAWKLHELGNSLPSIQAALEGSGGTPEDVATIMAKLIALEQARRARFRRTTQWGLAGGLAVILLLLIIAAVLGSLGAPSAPARVTPAGSVSPRVGTPSPGGTPAPGQAEPAPTLAYNPIVALLNQLLPGDVKIANGPTPTPASTSALLGGLFPGTPTLSAQDLATGDAKKARLPAWVATLVPNSVSLLNGPTPSIDPSGPPVSPCPTTSDQASALFGGPASSWTFNHQQQGWILIVADKFPNIRVPAGMSAGYLVIGESLQMRSVAGPVTVHNVNFIAVTCQ